MGVGLLRPCRQNTETWSRKQRVRRRGQRAHTCKPRGTLVTASRDGSHRGRLRRRTEATGAVGGGEKRLAECRGSAPQCVSDRGGGLVCRFGSFWRRWVRCGARGLCGCHARWELSVVVCESKGAGDRGGGRVQLRSGLARLVRRQACFSVPGEPTRGGDDLKGPESGDLKGPESRPDSQAKLGELGRGAAPLAGSVLARSAVCCFYWLARAALGGAGAPGVVCSRFGVARD